MNSIYDRPANEIRLTEPCFEVYRTADAIRVEHTIPDGDIMVYFYVLPINSDIEWVINKNIYDLCDTYSYCPFNGSSKSFTEFVLTNNRLPRPEELEKIILMDVLQ